MSYLAAAGLVTFLLTPDAEAAAPPPFESGGKHPTVLQSGTPSGAPSGTQLVTWGITQRLGIEPEVSSAKPQPLDLRMPEVAASARLDERQEPFPNFSRHDLIAMHGERELTEAGWTQRALSRTEVLANQFRHQGLPVARIWENDSALVHLGLNQKGKPGLWFVQKLQ